MLVIDVAPDVAAIVRPQGVVVDDVHVREQDAGLDEPLRLAAAALRTRVASSEITDAVRGMYRRFGIDPTKTRPSSEALLRRVRKGGELPRVNSLVDIINWCSVESQLPFGLYDLDRIQAPVTARMGRPEEEYPGIRKDMVHLERRLTLVDAIGPFGNPTSDSARTMITTATTRAFVVIFAPAGVDSAIVERTKGSVLNRIRQYA